MRRISYAEWQASREANRESAARLREFFGPYRRTRPRDKLERDLLIEVGCPEHLLGPEAPSAGSR